ncbi:hypothetical protein A3A15_00390 [Candidatus Giovannonibacteria bacterium RIFCSPLOWO2_01_FULL_43_60]|nr:MAG: hypothetical protein A3A15_00390 [Candidatus Giovannonibacteria bacterium RIFCSPLOWO2_01_FULL_43_60]
MRKTQLAKGEFYHIYNRGVDKRDILLDFYDISRFIQSMEEFNSVEPIGSIYEKTFLKSSQVDNSNSKLVDIVCYCLNSNHYHFILKQISEKGVEKFMHRLSTGYTRYFNDKYKRNGALFQGTYKAIHIDSNEYLLHLSAYVNLNNHVHKLGGLASKSSWEEYLGNKSGFCGKEIILQQFQDTSDYERFAQESLKEILESKKNLKELENYLLEESELGG